MPHGQDQKTNRKLDYVEESNDYGKFTIEEEGHKEEVKEEEEEEEEEETVGVERCLGSNGHFVCRYIHRLFFYLNST